MTRPRVCWAEGAKDGIGTAIDETSRVWFTEARGRLTDVFYPTPDRACIRSLGFVVVGDEIVSEEHADASHTYARPYAEVPLSTVVNQDREGRYRIEKETIADPRSSVVLQRVRWRVATAARLYCVLEPHLDNRSDANHAEVLEHREANVLSARRGGVELALACSRGWSRCSAEVSGASEDLGGLREHRALTVCRTSAHGCVALIGEVEPELEGEMVLSLARGLFRGQPTGSAAPLGWAHAEYVKLCRSIADGRVFDIPSAPSS